MEFKTMTGIDIEALPAILDAELPAEAYTSVPGGADLTDIDPGYMRKVLNETFGICGLGWGYDYQSGDIRDHNTGETGQRSHEGTVTRLEFWYNLVDENGDLRRCYIPASGGSENRNASYALKGAITNAIGQAASNLGFQESVYLGHRSHRTVGGKKPAASGADAAAARKAAAAQSAGKPAPAPVAAPKAAVPAQVAPKPAQPSSNGHKPAQAVAPATAAAPTAVAELEPEGVDDLDAATGPVADPGAYIVPVGRHQGKTIAQAAADEAGWLEKAVSVTHDDLRNAAIAYKHYLDHQDDESV